MADPYILVNEAVILVRSGNRTMAIHVPSIWVNLEAIVDEPPLSPDTMYFNNPTVTGYAMNAHGKADRITIWDGPDPFDHLPIEAADPALDASDV
jgi:hypothetical protein